MAYLSPLLSVVEILAHKNGPVGIGITCYSMRATKSLLY